jgi:hypothetical protein
MESGGIAGSGFDAAAGRDPFGNASRGNEGQDPSQRPQPLPGETWRQFITRTVGVTPENMSRIDWGAVSQQYGVPGGENGLDQTVGGGPAAPATVPGAGAGSGAAPAGTDPLQAIYNAIFGKGTPPGGGISSGIDPATGQPYTSNVQDKLLQAESSFIPEMLSPNYRSTQAGAAAYESAAAPINAKYDEAKRQAEQNAGMQGVAGTSGIVLEQLQQIENERAQALSDVERQFNATLPQRQTAGLSQLTNLLGIQQQEGLQSLGIQENLDQAQRQRYLDAAALGGNQGAAALSNAAGGAASLIGAASNLGSVYGNQAASQASGLGSLLGSIPGFTAGITPATTGPTAYDTNALLQRQGGNPALNVGGAGYTGSTSTGPFAY